jgi:hypothetical protein
MNTKELKSGYEPVFTMTEYYDGPVKGIANFMGKAHFYERVFDKAKDEYSNLFLLTPISAESFELAIEDWAIWRRWETAYHTGKADIGSHPALPNEANRHAELKQILDKSLVTDRDNAITRVGQFEVLGESDLPKGVFRALQVKWSQPRTESLSKSLDVR